MKTSPWSAAQRTAQAKTSSASAFLMRCDLLGLERDPDLKKAYGL